MTDLGTLGTAIPTATASRSTGAARSSARASRDRQVGVRCCGENGKIVDLGSLGGSFGAAVAINDRGQAIGVSIPAGGSSVHAFVWQDGKLTDLGTLGGAESDPSAINEHDQIVGLAQHRGRQGARRPLDAQGVTSTRPGEPERLASTASFTSSSE